MLEAVIKRVCFCHLLQPITTRYGSKLFDMESQNMCTVYQCKIKRF